MCALCVKESVCLFSLSVCLFAVCVCVYVCVCVTAYGDDPVPVGP